MSRLSSCEDECGWLPHVTSLLHVTHDDPMSCTKQLPLLPKGICIPETSWIHQSKHKGSWRDNTTLQTWGDIVALGVYGPGSDKSIEGQDDLCPAQSWAYMSHNLLFHMFLHAVFQPTGKQQPGQKSPLLAACCIPLLHVISLPCWMPSHEDSWTDRGQL